MIDINRKDYYLFNVSDFQNSITKDRLIELNSLGMEEVGYGEFGIPGLMSGLYIERVWNFNAVNWKNYIDWVKSLQHEQKG